MGRLAYDYKGIKIYDDTEKGLFYIYLNENGKQRIDFATEKEVEEYIDDEDEGIPKYTYFVKYIDSVDSVNGPLIVEAISVTDAKTKAKIIMGDEIKQFLEIKKEE